MQNGTEDKSKFSANNSLLNFKRKTCWKPETNLNIKQKKRELPWKNIISQINTAKNNAGIWNIFSYFRYFLNYFFIICYISSDCITRVLVSEKSIEYHLKLKLHLVPVSYLVRQEDQL